MSTVPSTHIHTSIAKINDAPVSSKFKTFLVAFAIVWWVSPFDDMVLPTLIDEGAITVLATAWSLIVASKKRRAAKQREQLAS